MLIEVWRKIYTDKSTEGQMSLDGIHEAYTLEPPRDQSHGKPYCVPEGIYPWSIGPSAHFNRNVVKLFNIPGFDNIEIHPGNFPQDTHGCTLVGRTEGADFVGQSDVEFDALMSKLPPRGLIRFLDSNTM